MAIALRRVVTCSLLYVAFYLPGLVQAVETVPASYVTVSQQRILDGVIEAEHQATISAQTAGRVVKINYDVDDFVSKGNILIQFRDREAQAALKAAQANFSEAEAEFNRVKDIFAKKLVAKAALDKAEARFKSAQAQLDSAKENLEHTVVRAPYSGIVVKRHIEVGELAQPGRPLMTGLSLEALRVSLNLPQDVIHEIRKHAKAEIILPGGRRVMASKLVISPYADDTSHAFHARATLPADDYGVYPGMFCKVAFVTGEEQRLLVPSSAVTQRSEVSAVYIKDNNGKLHYRQVRVGRRLPDKQAVEILAGLTENEQVVLDPVQAAAELKQQEQ